MNSPITTLDVVLLQTSRQRSFVSLNLKNGKGLDSFIKQNRGDERRNNTGSTVSYWIQQELFTESKRLLYHSDAAVKEIAHELGYRDHSYFIRSFRKACGSSPSKFRAVNR